MLRRTAIACAIAALALCGLGTVGASAKSSSTTCAGAYVVAKDAASQARAKAAILCIVNRERAARGVRSMRPSAVLNGPATAHSADMVAGKYLSHTGSAGDSVYQRVSRAGYAWTAVGETLTWGAGQRSMPSRLVASFLQSPEHRSILLDPNYRDLGVGLALGAPVRNARGASSTLTLVFGNS
jgi:uncharacterized protein YkwD